MSDENKVVTWENNILIREEISSQNQRIFDRASKAYICGRMETEFEFSHELKGERFYRVRVCVKRPKGVEDFIPISIPEKLIEPERLGCSQKNKWIKVVGGLRSRDEKDENQRKHLKLFVFARRMEIYEEKDEQALDGYSNLIYLKGHICRPTSYQVTPSGKQVTEMCLSVNKTEKDCVYLPCLAWQRNAEKASKLKVQDQVELYGRLQSRIYFKRFSPDTLEGTYKETHEVSVIKMKKVEN